MNGLLTHWGKELDKDCPHAEYPRPQLRRTDWTCLNGTWQYAIRDGGWGTEPESYDGVILVPFSPESILSGVNRQVLPGQTLWYKREVSFGAVPEGKRLLLNFGAVDQRCAVYVNGRVAGGHEGGYWPFSIDITDFIREGENTLIISVSDDSDTGLEAYGKQKLKRGGIWYTAQSGIWQTVWTETVSGLYVKSLDITPKCADSEVEFKLGLSGIAPGIHARIFAGGALVAEGRFTDSVFRLPLPGFRSWSPDDPFLYDVMITAGDDEIESYFGMREFGIIRGNDGLPRLSLNGSPVFHSGLLDQGYWSDGLYTAPSDEAVISELTEVKRLGFNMLRKHIKIEPLRWYYHCDRLGILVWQDFVSGGGPYGQSVTRYFPFIGFNLRDDRGWRGFGRRDADGRAVFMRDAKRTVELLRSVVSLAVWVPFNEGWGQFDSRTVTDMVRGMGGTRAVDHASGWHDQGCGDFASRHIYYKPFRMKPDKRRRVQALTEFGGYSCPEAGHMSSDNQFGYRTYEDRQSLTDALLRLYRDEVIPYVRDGLSAAVYTQLSDVEDEINGLFTYDRAALKPDPDVLRRINKELISPDS